MIIFLMTLLVLLSTLAFTQSKETGAIVGTVKDEEGTLLPGVTITLTSPSLIRARTFVTDEGGQYRFPALPPGEYAIKAELQGFGTTIQEKIRLTTTVRLTVDFVLKPVAVAEEVTVMAQSPTVDIKSTETASVTLSNEILRNVPYSQFTAELVNMAPGVTPSEYGDSAYGAQSGTGIAYSMDGVNVADPEGGTAWVFLDHNIIEEAKIMGIGLPAEYGNFTGVIFNIITKSGGNEFSGHLELIYQGEKEDWPHGFWQQDNNNAYLDDFPDLSSPRYKLFDGNVHLGGPIKKDKIWFYEGLQFQHFADYPTGFPEARAYNQPRSFTKITSQLTPSTNLTFSLEVDTYDGKNRGGSAISAPDAVLNQKSPEIVGNFGLTQIISPMTFFDVKAAYFWGYYYLEPETGRDKYAHFDTDLNKRLYNRGYYYLADRSRFQANASLTHYVEDFISGHHDFKFGVEVERSTCRSRFAYTGYGGPLGDHVYYVDYWSYNQSYGYNTGNYLAYQYQGYDFDSPYTRVEGFAQDAWTITPRLNINLGARLTQTWGQIKGVGNVWKTFRIAPRIGFTFDVLGDKTTILKAHYGQFTEGMFAAYHNRLSPKWYDYISYYWDLANEEWVEFDRVTQNWHLQDNIKHPYMNQFTVSLERELFKDASVTLSYIYRDWKNIIGVYDVLAEYEKLDYKVGPLNNKIFPVYELTSGSAHEFWIENIRQGADRPYVLGKPYRKYQGFQFLFNKRFSNKWQLLFSYTYSQTKGTIDNEWGGDIGWQNFSVNSMIAGDPNYWTNGDGYATYNPTHMLKIQGTYVLPFDINLSASFRAISGYGYAQRFRTRTLSQGRVTFFVEQRGSRHYPMEKILDLRLEKVFTLAQKYRLGLIVDVFNVFNSDTVMDWGERIGYDWLPGSYPSTDGHKLYGIVDPRQVRLGFRVMF